MSHLSFYRDEQGAPRAQAENEETEVLGAFLESDIQDDAVTCRELLARIDDEIDELSEPVEFTGNRHAVTFTNDTVVFSSHQQGDDSSAMLDLHQVQTALKGWLAFIES